MSAVAPDVPAEQVVVRLVEAQVAVRGFRLTRPTLEDVFVELIEADNRSRSRNGGAG